MFIREVRGGVAENAVKCGPQFLHIALVLLNLGSLVFTALPFIQYM